MQEILQLLEFLFPTQPMKRTDVIDMIHVWTLPKENEMC